VDVGPAERPNAAIGSVSVSGDPGGSADGGFEITGAGIDDAGIDDAGIAGGPPGPGNGGGGAD